MSWDGISRWQGGEHEAELPSLSWDDARSLREAGWEIGSHTCSHPRLTRLPDDRLARELAESKERCEANLGSCLSLAYPYGDHDGRVVAAAEGAGYRFACTLPDRLPAAAPLAWPRIGIYHGDTLGDFRRKVSPRMIRLRRSSLWPVVLSTRRRLSAARSRR
jgi:peptidoglycan/xylan/chitin deacetylase (PgdA/CDA1 family)